MRKFLLVAAFGLTPLLLPAAPASAQPFALPPGPYAQQCTGLYMEGQFLHGWCRGQYGAGHSSINVESCSTEIFVDPSGALTCVGPGAGAPPANVPPAGYGPPFYSRGYDARRGYAPWPGYAAGQPPPTTYALPPAYRPGWPY
jgi:hypothetical protein